jgi:hypothetical protein
METESDRRAERLLGQLHEWAMEGVALAREERQAFIADVAARYHDDAVRNGSNAIQAEEWRENVAEWLAALIDVIETSGGATGGHA